MIKQLYQLLIAVEQMTQTCYSEPQSFSFYYQAKNT